MKLNPKVAAALNNQINAELNASYVYLSMAAWFDSHDLPGFAKWFRGHSTEETEHGMRIYDFVVKREERVELQGIAVPPVNYDSPKAVLEAALAHEKMVTAQINALFELAHEEKEYSTQNMLHWFLEEQIEEEDLFRSSGQGAGPRRGSPALIRFRGRNAPPANRLRAAPGAAPQPARQPFGVSQPAEGAEVKREGCGLPFLRHGRHLHCECSPIVFPLIQHPSGRRP